MEKALFNAKSVTVDYAGNDNINGGSDTGDATISQRTLKYTVTADGREYVKGSTVVTVHLTPADFIEGDNVILTATGNLSAEDVDTYRSVNLTEITIDGTDKAYYTVDNTADNVTLTAPVTISQTKAVVEHPPTGATGLTYTGSPLGLLTGEATPTGGTMQYYVGEKDSIEQPDETADWKEGFSNITATDAGTYRIWYRANGNLDYATSELGSITVTIEKAESSVTTDPTPNNRAYDGADHPLVEAGTAEGGTIQYSLEENGEYSEAIPNSQGAKDYTVWYKVVGDANHKDIKPTPITVTIEKGEGKGSVTMGNYFCLQTDVNPEPKSDTNGIENVTYTYTVRGQDNYSNTKPTTAGEYTVKAEFAATDNYNSFTETADFTIYHHFDGWEAEDDGYQNTCPCNTGVRLQETEFNTAPESLKNIEGLQTVEEIKQVLVEEVRKDTSIPEKDTAVYDVRLQVQSGGSGWVDVAEENFPEDGITVILPYPEGTNSSYTFTVIHMITTGENAGKMENLEPTNGEDGISFTVKSLSPICVGWTAPPSSSGSYPSYYSVTVPSDFEGGSVTSDRASAQQGNKVTLTVKPYDGYHFDSLTVNDRNGKPVELTDNGDGTYTFTMPYGQVTVAAEFVKCGSLDFTDLDASAWYHDYTDYVIAHGLMNGIGGGLFEPGGTVNRAQMVMVLWNMSGKPVVNYYMTYSDVSEDAWYAEAIRWATSEGIASGYGGGLFGPNDPISREQMAAMIYRYEQKYGDGGFTGDWMYRLPFTDLDQISDWAFESVAWCNLNGIIKGKDNGVFDPKGLAKRSEMAAILTRYCGEETGEE